MDRKAMVVVLGDLARSPRMQYHCISLAKHNYDVSVIANRGGQQSIDRSNEKLERNPNIKKCLMTDAIDFKKFLPTMLAFILKPIWQSFLLIIQLIRAPVPHVIIVQNPPSVPTLPIMYAYKIITGSRLILDWHNYGFSILGLSLSSNHPAVRLYRFIEMYFGRLADAGFCVSEAMQRDLFDNFDISYPLYILYDKPPNHFKPMSPRSKLKFFMQIQDEYPVFKSRISNGDVDRRDPVILLSSTSWTEDENFDVLLDALQSYDIEANCTELELPRIICVITGKGPLKSHYQAKINKLQLSKVEFVLPWLSAENYAKMVGSCDIGISLHKSSSGVDLPMKVVDLFGCGVPVLAYKYSAINELVVENFYGLTFNDSQDLYAKLIRLLGDFSFPHSRDRTPCEMDRFRANIIENFSISRWETNWKQIAKPLFERLYKCSSGARAINVD